MPCIGPIELKNPFALAALAGFSELPMRRICRKLGAGYAVNAMALGSSATYGGEWSNRLLRIEEDDHPTAVQLIGQSAEEFAAAAKLVAKAGYDAIDINFGCPAPKMQKKCRGGFLLGQPDTAIDIIHAVLDAAGHQCPITIKMRKGLDESPESRTHFFRILDAGLEAGIAAFTVHGRTVEQKYKGKADWAFLKNLKEYMGKHVLLGSGDLMTANDCIRMISETGVDGVTIARGAIGNPWIFRDCLALLDDQPIPDPPTLEEQRTVILEHYEESLSYFGSERAERVMIRFAMKYARHHPTPRKVRYAFASLHNPLEFSAVFSHFWGT